MMCGKKSSTKHIFAHPDDKSVISYFASIERKNRSNVEFTNDLMNFKNECSGQFVVKPYEKFVKYTCVRQLFIIKTGARLKEKYHLFVNLLIEKRELVFRYFKIESCPSQDYEGVVPKLSDIRSMMYNTPVPKELEFLNKCDSREIYMFLRYHLHPGLFPMYKFMIASVRSNILLEDEFIGLYDVGYENNEINLNNYINKKTKRNHAGVLLIGEQVVTGHSPRIEPVLLPLFE